MLAHQTPKPPLHPQPTASPHRQLDLLILLVPLAPDAPNTQCPVLAVLVLCAWLIALSSPTTSFTLVFPPHRFRVLVGSGGTSFVLTAAFFGGVGGSSYGTNGGNGGSIEFLISVGIGIYCAPPWTSDTAIDGEDMSHTGSLRSRLNRLRRRPSRNELVSYTLSRSRPELNEALE